MILWLYLHSLSEPGDKILLSALITQKSSMVEFYLLLKLITFLSTCVDISPIFFLFNTHSSLLLTNIENFCSAAVGFVFKRNFWTAVCLELGMGSSCILTEGEFVRVIEIMVEGAEIRKTLPRWIDEPEIKILREQSCHILKLDYQSRI